MKNKKIKKEVSNEGLSIMIEDLARITANGFGEVGKRLSDLEKGQKDLEIGLSNLEEGQKKIRGSILEIGDKFVSKFEFDKSLNRITKVEEKIKHK